MAYGESNGHVIDDVTRPLVVMIVTPICPGPIISKNGWRYRLGYNGWVTMELAPCENEHHPVSVCHGVAVTGGGCPTSDLSCYLVPDT